MIPHITKGADVRGLLGYLVTTESRTDVRANQHEHPRVVGGEPFLTTVHGGQDLEQADARVIADYLDRPRQSSGAVVRVRRWEQNAEGERVAVLDKDGHQASGDQHVWHCSLSLADGERLSEQQWGEVSREFAEGMGFTGSDGHTPARWVAIHHGEGKGGHDHVHVVASMVREDGTKWSAWRDFPKAQQVCRELEQRHGLVQVLGREHGTATRGASPAELREQQRSGAPVIQREALANRVRGAAVASASEAEWVRRVRAAGVIIRPRFAEGRTDVVVGYRAALRGQAELRFYGGGHLGRDLSLPRLRETWPEPTLEQAGEAAAEWQAAAGGRPPVAPQEAQPSVRAAREDLSKYADKAVRAAKLSPAATRMVARDISGVLGSWATFDAVRAADLTAAAAVMSRTAQERRPGLSAGASRRRGATAGGAAAVFAVAKAADRPAISAALLMAQLVRAAEAVAAAHRAGGNLREADRIGTDVVGRLSRMDWSGYNQRQDPAVPTRAPLQPAPYTSRASNREDGRDAGR